MSIRFTAIIFSLTFPLLRYHCSISVYISYYNLNTSLTSSSLMMLEISTCAAIQSALILSGLQFDHLSFLAVRWRQSKEQLKGAAAFCAN
jgi:hypothetical protein